jgi:phage gpG-like protein
MNGIKGDDAKLKALVARLESAARGQMAAALRKELAARTRDEIDRAFADRRSPDGRGWPPTKRGGAPLDRSGALRAGFEVNATDAGVRVTNSVPYANVHQHGGRLRRRRRPRGARRVSRVFGFGAGAVPARPMVPTSRWGPGPTARLRAASSRIVHRFFALR